MPSNFDSPVNASRESLGALLLSAGGISVVLLLIILYFLWRDKKLKIPEIYRKKLPSKTRRKRR